jgi:2-polyprenyl-3-methyl-5-hydroxy-6-metoxy-1,4-benzoquinol methylase
MSFPILRELTEVGPGLSVLEIGCAEAGNLKPFLDRGCLCTGIDISCGRIELAEEYFAGHPKRDNLELICEDIYKADLKGRTFDLIIMRDVIEHIPNQEKFMGFAKKFLKPDGKFFLAFPPWQNPFGGHQQVCRNKILSKLPWFHLLPKTFTRLSSRQVKKTKRKWRAFSTLKPPAYPSTASNAFLKRKITSSTSAPSFL